MRRRMEYIAFALLFVALGVNIYLNLRTSAQLTTTVTQSAQTRVTTVTQRCGLTMEIANFSLHVEQVLAQDAPQAVPPFSRDYAAFESSYRSCETQLVHVETIARQSP
jgi:hypothetical protein